MLSDGKALVSSGGGFKVCDQNQTSKRSKKNENVIPFV